MEGMQTQASPSRLSDEDRKIIIEEVTGLMKEMLETKPSSGSLARALSIRSSELLHEVPHIEPEANTREVEKKEYTQKQVEKLIKELNLPTEPITFMNEKHWDDTLDAWTDRCVRLGYPADLVSTIVYRQADLSVKSVIEQEGLANARIDVIRDVVARSLYTPEVQMDEIELSLQDLEPKEDFRTNLAKLEKMWTRYEKLCRRWQVESTLNTLRKKRLVFKLLTHEERKEVLKTNWEEKGLHEFKQACRKVHELESKAHTISGPLRNQPKEISAHPISMQPDADKRSTRCFNCGQLGHWTKQCPNPSLRCQTCGKKGHTEEHCRTITTGRGISKSHVTIRDSPGRIYIDLNTARDKVAELKELTTYFSEWANKAERTNAMARKRRVERRVESDLPDMSHPEENWYQGTMEAGCVQTRSLTIGEAARAVPRCLVKSKIHGLNVMFLVDPGAEISILSRDVWDRLPKLDTFGAIIHQSPNDFIKGVSAAKTRIKHVVELPIELGKLTTLHRFAILSEENSINLLGMSWVAEVGANVMYQHGYVSLSLHGNMKLPLIPESRGLLSAYQAKVVSPRQTDALDIGLESHSQAYSSFENLIRSYEDLWKNNRCLPSNAAEHSIDTETSRPIRCRPAKTSASVSEEIRKQVAELLEGGYIRESKSAWASRVVMVPKKNGELRMCIDYRALNKVTRIDAYPLPLINSLLSKLGGSRWFSVVDLKSGYHQISLKEKDKEKTAFITTDGLYEYNVMPFGLCNAPATFQRAMNKLFEDLLITSVCVYMDDIVIHTLKLDEHYFRLREVLNRLKAAKLKINIKKSRFLCTEIKYLGFVIAEGELHPDPEKLKTIQAITPPRNLKELRQFLGMVNYFRRLIPSMASRAEPLTSLLKKGEEWLWGTQHQVAFEDLKDSLTKRPILLKLPSPDLPWVLDTDASGTAIAAILQQKVTAGKYQVVGYASKLLNETERRWSIREKEAYAIFWSILHFAEYLRDAPYFTVRTDHESLRWLWSTDNSRVARWALALQEFNFSVKYQPGKHQQHVDYFTRCLPIDPEEDVITERIACTSPLLGTSVLAIGLDSVFPKFPDVEKFRQETMKEEPLGEATLIKGAQGLYYTSKGKTYVPLSLRKALLYYFHFSKTGGHQGVHRTARRLGNFFWWPRYKADVQQYLSECMICKRRRCRQAHKSARGTLLADAPNTLIAMDFVGPFTFKDSTVHLLTMIDHYSRNATAKVVEGTSSKVAIKGLLQEWIAHWGCPSYLLTDNGPAFTSAEFLDFCRNYGISKLSASPYYPQGDGVVEAFHKLILHALSAYPFDSSKELKEILRFVLMAYKSTPHPSTGESPHFLITGEEFVTPGMQEWTIRGIEATTKHERVLLLHELQREYFNHMVMLAVTKLGKRHPLDKEETTFSEGETVLYWLTPAERARYARLYPAAKLAPSWSEPYKVMSSDPTQHPHLVRIRSVWRPGDIKFVHPRNLQKMKPLSHAAAAHEVMKDIKRDFKGTRNFARCPIDKVMHSSSDDIREDKTLKSEGIRGESEPINQQLVPVPNAVDHGEHRSEISDSPHEPISKRPRANCVCVWV